MHQFNTFINLDTSISSQSLAQLGNIGCLKIQWLLGIFTVRCFISNFKWHVVVGVINVKLLNISNHEIILCWSIMAKLFIFHLPGDDYGIHIIYFTFISLSYSWGKYDTAEFSSEVKSLYFRKTWKKKNKTWKFGF